MLLSRNVLLLLFLYFIQGLPYGFQVQFLPLHLHSMGVDLTNIGLMRLFHIPWLCKAIWAPFIDKYSTKRKWLLASIAGLILTSLCSCFISSDSIGALCVILFLLNLFASTQDIAVDGIAVSLLSSHELGTGNTAQVVGYKIGSIFGGGVLIWFMDLLGWSGLFLALTILYIEAFMFVFVSPSLRYQESRLIQWQDTQKKVEKWQQNSYYYSDHSNDEDDDDDDIDDNHCVSNGFYVASEQSLLVNKVASNDGSNSDCDRNHSSNDQHISNKDCAQNDLCASGLKRRTMPDPIYHQTNRSLYPDSDSEDDLLDAEHLVQRINEKEQERRSMSVLCKSVLAVPGTRWLAVFVLIYKLGEQGALGMMPLYLIEKQITTGEVGFWTGVVGQAASICGSLLGGWIITDHRIPPDFVLQQICLLRLLPLGVEFLIIFVWSLEVMPATVLFYSSVGTVVVLMLLSGMVTTATFTLMMQCSRLAAPTLQATHYTMLATVEVFGKLTFMTMAGWLVDRLGYPFMFIIFIILTVLSSYWFRKCPDDLLSTHQNHEMDESEDSMAVPNSKDKVF